MLYRQLFIIEGRLLGESQRHDEYKEKTLSEPDSLLFYCQRCGEVYARCPVYRPDGSLTAWQALRATCRKCGPHQQWLSEWPGSVWLSWDREYLAALPVLVLQWEFDRHIDSWERVQNGFV